MSGKSPLGNPRDPQSYEGIRIVVPVGGWQVITAKRAPTTSDIKYPTGSLWINTATNSIYFLTSAPGNWSLAGSSSGGAVNTLTGDSGGAIMPAAGNITLAGNATQGVSTSGSGSTITTTVAQSTSSQFGVIKTASNAQAIAGTDANNAVTAASLLAKLGATQTAHGVLLAEGNTSAFSVTGAGTTGQVLAGSTGADPAFVASAELNFVDQTTGSVTMAVGTTYIADAATLVTFTLPATATQGSIVNIVGNGAGGWKIAQAASQQINMNNQSTTAGTGGSLSSTNRYNSLSLYATVGGASTIWVVRSFSGSFTFV